MILFVAWPLKFTCMLLMLVFLPPITVVRICHPFLVYARVLCSCLFYLPACGFFFFFCNQLEGDEGRKAAVRSIRTRIRLLGTQIIPVGGKGTKCGTPLALSESLWCNPSPK